ncbi:unnamed protein product, partial [Durusdinium trenchii]
ASHKRSRAMDSEETSTVTMQHWRRLMLRVLMLVNQAMQHLVSGRLNMTGFKGYRLQQMACDLPLLETSELEDLMQLCQEQIQSRQMDELDGFSIISGQTLRSNASSETPTHSPGKSKPPTRMPASPPKPCSAQTEIFENPPYCQCRLATVRLITYKSGRNYLRHFWRCPKWQNPMTRCRDDRVPPMPTSPDYSIRLKRLDCGKLLEKVSKTGPKATSSKEPIPSESEQELWEQFQAFQRLRRGSQGSK